MKRFPSESSAQNSIRQKFMKWPLRYILYGNHTIVRRLPKYEWNSRRIRRYLLGHDSIVYDDISLWKTEKKSKERDKFE